MAAARNDAPEHAAPLAPPGIVVRHSWNTRFGIQSKLLIMLLLVSVLSSLAIGYMGYRAGSEALRSSVFDRLTALRESRRGQIERYFGALRNQLVVLGRDPTVVESMRAFASEFKALENSQLSAEQRAELESFYRKDFAAQLDQNVTGTPAVAEFLPSSAPQAYLQYHYTIASTNDDVTAAVVDANDGSQWSSTHRRVHPFLREMSSRFEFEDVLFVDPGGNVVYTVSKSIDLGANLLDQPYSTTLLGRAFQSMLSAGSVDDPLFTDFQEYVPSFDTPTAFVLTPIHADSNILGVAVVKLPVLAVDRIMTDAGNWETDGLGQTGETYLAGTDFLMRSQSRFLLEDPQAFAQQVRSAGTPEQTIQRMLKLGTTILLQPVRSPSVEAAASGETGTLVTRDYRNIDVLSSFARVDLPELSWVIVSKIDTSEAFAPERAFSRWLLLSTAAIIVTVTFASLALVQVIARPIRRLAAGARRVTAGDTSTAIQLNSRDELGELAGAFESLRTTLQQRDEQLAQREQERQGLLLKMMPEPVAQRVMSGEPVSAQEHQNVAVLAATLDGWNTLAEGLDAEASSALLNEVVRALEDAADRTGVERTRVNGSSFLVTSGLLVPRVDYTKRVVDFARAARDIVERFNKRNKAALHLRTGIDAGSVTSALIGDSMLNYDIWGEPVEVARRLKGHVHVEGILVSDRVYRRLREIDAFEPAGSMDTPYGTQAIWTLVEGKAVANDVPSGNMQG